MEWPVSDNGPSFRLEDKLRRMQNEALAMARAVAIQRLKDAIGQFRAYTHFPFIGIDALHF